MPSDHPKEPNAEPRRTGVYDFFISYKRSDSADLAAAIATNLTARGYDTWLDEEELRPGDSILSAIENGLRSCIDAVLILSKNYFTGWSEQERRSLFSLMTSKKVRIIPIWYKLVYADVEQAAPMFVDIKSITMNNKGTKSIDKACDMIASSYRPDQRRSRLFEIFFRCLSSKFPDDHDLKLFLAVFDNNIEMLKESLDKGANVNITDTELWNRYNRASVSCGCFNEFRKLFLYLVSVGAISNSSR